ncbi:MAG: hypothetical protein ACRDP6_24630 [Actinoallomurus sp.]
MTITTEKADSREYGVRLRVPGEADRIIPCGDLASAEGVLTNPPRGVIAVEIVGRPALAWETAPEGLIADVRTTAEQYLDEEIGEDVVRFRLHRWLPDLDLDDLDALLSGPWPELLEDIEAYRKADDGDVDWLMVEPEMRDQELLVQRHDGLVIDAVRRVIGGRS